MNVVLKRNTSRTALITPHGTFRVPNHFTTEREALMYLFGIDPETQGGNAIEAAIKEQLRMQEEYDRIFGEKSPRWWNIIEIDADRRIALVRTTYSETPVNLITKKYIFNVPEVLENISAVLFGIFGPLEGRKITDWRIIEEVLMAQPNSVLLWAHRYDVSIRSALKNFFLLDERPEFEIAVAVNPEGTRKLIVRNEVIQIQKARTVPEAFEEAFGIGHDEALTPETIEAVLAFLALGTAPYQEA